MWIRTNEGLTHIGLVRTALVSGDTLITIYGEYGNFIGAIEGGLDTLVNSISKGGELIINATPGAAIAQPFAPAPQSPEKVDETYVNGTLPTTPTSRPRKKSEPAKEAEEKPAESVCPQVHSMIVAALEKLPEDVTRKWVARLKAEFNNKKLIDLTEPELVTLNNEIVLAGRNSALGWGDGGPEYRGERPTEAPAAKDDAPVKEEDDPFGDALKKDAEKPTVKAPSVDLELSEKQSRIIVELQEMTPEYRGAFEGLIATAADKDGLGKTTKVETFGHELCSRIIAAIDKRREKGEIKPLSGQAKERIQNMIDPFGEESL